MIADSVARVPAGCDAVGRALVMVTLLVEREPLASKHNVSGQTTALSAYCLASAFAEGRR